MTKQEKQKLKTSLMEAMSNFIEKETHNDNNNLGWIEDNLDAKMADAAFAVLESSIDLNVFMKEQGIFKD